MLLRSLLALLDLVGILAIGFLVTSSAISLSGTGGTTSQIEFAGISLPLVNSSSIAIVASAVLALFIVKAICSIVLTKKAAFFIANIEARASEQIARVSFGGDLGNARQRSREEVMFAITAGSPAAFNIMLNSVNTFVTESTLFVVVLMGFFFIDPIATFAAVIYFALIVGIMQIFIGSRMTKAGEVSAKNSMLASSSISNVLAVFRELLVLGKREKYINEIYRAKVASAESAANQYYLSGMPRYIIEAALLIGVALFVLSQVFSGDIIKSAGTIGIFLSGGFRLTAALLPLQSSLLTIKASIPSAKTAHDILQQSAHEIIQPREHTFTSTLDSGYSGPIGIEFRDIWFTYHDAQAPVLKGVSFTIEPGSQVALMGPSGAGKSTIADLICRVLSPSEGSIHFLYSNQNPAVPGDYGRVSYVPQKPGLVSGTIADNVALGVDRSEIDRNLVVESLNLAHLGNLLEALPDGIDTYLGKLQEGLSGGQIQRLGLARALYSSPGLLVMDEATSALDAESEHEIQTALEKMRGKVTVVIVAHRLNTIQHVDNVLLIEDGSLTDSGQFNELRSRNIRIERLVSLMRIDEN